MELVTRAGCVIRTRRQWFRLSIVGSAIVMAVASVLCTVITDTIIASRVRLEYAVYDKQCTKVKINRA